MLADLASTGPTTWRLTLPEGASFVNGTVLDGAALADLVTFQLAENASLAAALPGATAAATGPLEVTLTTTLPAPSVPALLADESILPVYDVASYREHRDSGAPASELVGAGIYTGPYVVDALDGAAAQLSPRADHWNGPPALAGVTVRFVPEASARIQAVQSGEADIALYPSTSSAPTLEARDDTFYVTGEPTGPTFQLVLNQHQAPFDDDRARRAVYSAVDYDAIANDVMNGLYLPATGLYVDSRPWAEKTQTTDVAAAGALLDEAGWVRDGEGPRTRDGQELRFSVLTYPQQPDSDTIALAFQAQLAELGVGVDIRQVPDLDAAMQQPADWNAAVAGNGFMSYGGDHVYPLVRYVSTGGERNHGGISDPELDALIDRLAVELDTTARDDLLRQVQWRIAEGGHLAYIGLRKPAVVTGPAWQGYEIEGSNLWVSHDTAPTG